MTSCVVFVYFGDAAVPLSLIMLSNSNRRPRWCESEDLGGWFSKKSELFNRTLLIMLLCRSFPEEAGGFPEGHFHLDWKHTSISHTCVHKHRWYLVSYARRWSSQLCPWGRWLHHFPFGAWHGACVCASVSRQYQYLSFIRRKAQHLLLLFCQHVWPCPSATPCFDFPTSCPSQAARQCFIYWNIWQ